MQYAERVVLHPFLLTLYPVAFLVANNIDRLQVSASFRLILILLLVVTIVFLLLRLLTRSWQRAGLIASLVMVLFSSYGHVYNFLSGKSVIWQTVGRADILAAFWASMMILIGWFILRKLTHLKMINLLVNTIAFFLFILPVLTIATHSVQFTLAQPKSVSIVQHPAAEAKLDNRNPDVYYIILDEHGRSDMLLQVLGYDNSAFIAGLHARGFYIADESYSNYNITLHSLASSLNSRYLHDYVSLKPGDETSNTRSLIEIIHNSNTRRQFQNAGYSFITFATGYAFSEIRDSDRYFEPEKFMNDLELLYLESSAFALFSDAINGARMRELIHYSFDALGNLPDMDPDQPKFIFAHTLSNHIPFVFGPNGEPVTPWGFSALPGERVDEKSYIQAYSGQAAYIDKLVLQTIDEILEKSKIKPVIILQSDHGTQALLDWYSYEDTCVKERHAILNAYYFPDGDYQNLYPSITPVNTFRVILKKYLDAELDHEPDLMFFSEWHRSYDFIDVTHKMEDCVP